MANNKDGWNSLLEEQLGEILTGREDTFLGACIADACLNNKEVTDLLRASLFASIKEGLKLALSRPQCKHCRDSRYCDKKLGVATDSGDLCMPLGLGALILLSCLKGYPSCTGYEF